MPVIPALPYDDFLAQADTGDVVLFAGGSAESVAVEWGTLGPFSHAAMVVIGPDGGKYLWQAAGLEVGVDKIKLKKHTGAQVTDLTEAVKLISVHYGEPATWRQLVWDRPPHLDAQIWGVMAGLDGRRFPTAWQLFEDYEEGSWLGIDLTDGPMFCSELVAYTFQQIGLMKPHPPANAYSPTAFSEEAVGTQAKLLHGSFAPDRPIDVSSLGPAATAFDEDEIEVADEAEQPS